MYNEFNVSQIKMKDIELHNLNKAKMKGPRFLFTSGAHLGCQMFVCYGTPAEVWGLGPTWTPGRGPFTAWAFHECNMQLFKAKHTRARTHTLTHTFSLTHTHTHTLSHTLTQSERERGRYYSLVKLIPVF